MDGQTGVSIFFNVENSIKREIRKKIMLEIPWNAKKTLNIEKKNLNFIFFNI